MKTDSQNISHRSNRKEATNISVKKSARELNPEELYMNNKTELQEFDKSLERESPDIVYQEKVKRVQKVKSTTVLKTESDEKPIT